MSDQPRIRVYAQPDPLPLGKITKDSTEFMKSLNAAGARTIGGCFCHPISTIQRLVKAFKSSGLSSNNTGCGGE